MKNNSTIKKIISVLLITLLLFTTKIYAVSDSYSTTITSSSYSVKRGDIVTIIIGLKDIAIVSGEKGICAYVASIKFDSSILEYKSTGSTSKWEAPFYQDGLITGNTKDGEVVKTTQPIGSITFKVKDNAKLGETSISLTNFSASTAESDVDALDKSIKIVIEEKKNNNNNTGNNNNSGNNNDNNNDNSNNNQENNNNNNTGNSNSGNSNSNNRHPVNNNNSNNNQENNNSGNNPGSNNSNNNSNSGNGNNNSNHENNNNRNNNNPINSNNNNNNNSNLDDNNNNEENINDNNISNNINENNTIYGNNKLDVTIIDSNETTGVNEKREDQQKNSGKTVAIILTVAGICGLSAIILCTKMGFIGGKIK